MENKGYSEQDAMIALMKKQKCKKEQPLIMPRSNSINEKAEPPLAKPISDLSLGEVKKFCNHCTFKGDVLCGQQKENLMENKGYTEQDAMIALMEKQKCQKEDPLMMPRSNSTDVKTEPPQTKPSADLPKPDSNPKKPDEKTPPDPHKDPIDGFCSECPWNENGKTCEAEKQKIINSKNLSEKEAIDVLMKDGSCQVEAPSTEEEFCETCILRDDVTCGEESKRLAKKSSMPKKRANESLMKNKECRMRAPLSVSKKSDKKILFCRNCTWKDNIDCDERKKYLMTKENMTREEAKNSLMKDGECQRKPKHL